MAKKPAPGPVEPYRVTLNQHDGDWRIDATSEDDAIDKVIEQTKSQRDRRNFTAIPVRLLNGLSAPIPAMPMANAANG